jgi:catechol 2,3-dioxygenase-like lactoylglutathione lyase family enzyme
VNIHHLAIATPDPQRLAQFYESVLGLARVREWPGEGGVRSVWLALGEALLMLERCGGSAAATPFTEKTPGLHVLALEIPAGAREDWRARLGARLVHETEYTLYVQDPDGNRVGLSCYDRMRA